MKRSKQKLIHQMEVQDDLGIKRGKKKSFLNIPLKTYNIIKLCLLVAVPFVYFMCSPLLVIVVGLYFALLFITNVVEKTNNMGLKKEFHVKFPKIDSILCLILVIIAVVGTIVSSTSFSQKKGMFDGFNQEQLEKIDDINFDESSLKKMRVGNKIVTFGALQTGIRYLFQEEKTFGGFGGGQFNVEGFSEPPEGFTPPSGDKPNINKSLTDMPFEMLFQTIVKAIAVGMIILIEISGVICFIKLKKIEKIL